MDKTSFCINIVSHANQTLNFIRIMQCKSIYFNIIWYFIPIDVPATLFCEFFQIRAALNFENNSFFYFTSFRVLQTGNNPINPYV